MFCIVPYQTIPSAVVVQPPPADVSNRTDVEMPPLPGLFICTTLQLKKFGQRFLCVKQAPFFTKVSFWSSNAYHKWTMSVNI